MYCKYCGRKLQEGEICSCRQQTDQKKPVKIQAPQSWETGQKPERQETDQPDIQRSGKILLALSFLCSILLIISYVLIRLVFQEELNSSALEMFYPYLTYILPIFWGALAFVFALFSLQDKKIRKGSLAAILVSIVLAGATVGAQILFPYEPQYYGSSDEGSEEEEAEDIEDKDGDADPENPEESSQTQSDLAEIKEEYGNKSIDYAGAKNALADLETQVFEGETGDEILEFQSQIENDLRTEIQNLASAQDYPAIMSKLKDQEEKIWNEDAVLSQLRETYEPEYLLYLGTESQNLIAAGKKDEAIKMLEEGQNLVEDKDVVDEMILDARNSRDTGEYILPESSSRYLTDADISGLTLQQINYAKNEIYARHGRKFQSAELQNYFNSKSWYSGTIEAADFDESVLNDFEKKNAELLSSKEFSMESGGYKLDQ
ncbi:MAG TPA: YARHG domain-containing protein [Candidatus Blautia avicola]|uniref:YARHG domain-containing protein n=1 Tax=Candidatus Blautia avicola TaxID=2838483 RepID=A0A9D2QUB5_9FIRM|nr:YARHG domain-containing protein [Candidatus Blautia avicola]